MKLLILRNVLLLISISFIVSLSSCNKNDDSDIPGSLAGYKISLVSGANQIDTVGNTLDSLVIFKVTYNGDTLESGTVRFDVYDCEGRVRSDSYAVGKSAPPFIGFYLNPRYSWVLNGNAAEQTLKAVLIDSNNIPQDSVTVSATALPPTKGWYNVACMPVNSYVTAICEQPSGRLLAAFKSSRGIYFSDDEGTSWHSLESFREIGGISRIISISKDEILVTMSGIGIFYSNDDGTHWEARMTDIPIGNFAGDILYTNSGDLFINTLSGVFLSHDKGAHWHLSYYGYLSNVVSTDDGIMIGFRYEGLVLSKDRGETWSQIWSSSALAGVSDMLVDGSSIYVAGGWINRLGNGIFVTKDLGQTWSKIELPADWISISSMTKVNGNFYFLVTDYKTLVQTKDFKSFKVLTPPNAQNEYNNFYLITKSNRIILTSGYVGMKYYIP